MILVISPTNTYAAKRLIEEAKRTGLVLDVLTPRLLAKADLRMLASRYKILYVRNPFYAQSPVYLPYVISLAEEFKSSGKTVVDENVAEGRLGLGKWEDYQNLKTAGILAPKTEKLKPGVYENPKLRPCVLKWVYGLRGKSCFFIQPAQTNVEIKNILAAHPAHEWLMQEYIEADYEYKVITVGYNSLPLILRFKIKSSGFMVDYQSAEVFGLSAGGFLSPASEQATLLKRVSSLAEDASRVLGRQLSKIDILQKGKKFYVLEVNRFPGLKSFETLTKYNVAAEFLAYLRQKPN